MKFITLLFLIVVGFCSAAPLEKRYIEFDGIKYYVGDEQRNDREQLTEYIPSGEGITDWSELVSVRTIQGSIDAKAYAANLRQLVLNSSPLAQCVVAQKKNVILVDFLTWPKDMSYGEFNLMKVVENKDGLTVYQYARKWRGKDWGEKLKAERYRLYDVIYDATFTEKK